MPIVGSLDEAQALGARRAADRDRAGRRQAAGGLEDADPGAIERGWDVESGSPRLARRRPRAGGRGAVRAGVEIRDLRRAPAGLDVPTGANLDVDAHTVLDRRHRLLAGQDDALPRARPGGPAARPGQRLRPHRPDRHRHRRLGHRRRRGGVGLRRRRLGAAGRRGRASGAAPGRCSGSRARARSTIRPTPASRWACCTGRRPTRCCSSTSPAATHLDMPRSARPIPPLTDLIEDLRADRRVRAAGAGGGRRAQDQPAGRGRCAVRDPRRAEADTGLPADDPVRFGAGRLLDAVLAGRGSIPHRWPTPDSTRWPPCCADIRSRSQPATWCWSTARPRPAACSCRWPGRSPGRGAHPMMRPKSEDVTTACWSGPAGAAGIHLADRRAGSRWSPTSSSTSGPRAIPAA